jgi:hypothetical protein
MKELLVEFFASILNEDEELDKQIIKYKDAKGKEGEATVKTIRTKGEKHPAWNQYQALLKSRQAKAPKKTTAKAAKVKPAEQPSKTSTSAEPKKRRGTPKKKDLDQKVKTTEQFNTDSRFAKDGVSDADFRKNPKVKPTSKSIKPQEIEAFFLDKNGKTRFPRKYVKVLSRLLSTKPGALTITDFTDASGAGTLSSTTGELLTMMALTIKDEKKATEFFQLVSSHVKAMEKGKESIIDSAWVKSAQRVRTAMFKRYDQKYGKGNWELDNMAWDIKDEVEGLGLADYKNNKGFSTDVYAKVKVGGKTVLDEISLKKELRANLLNATSGRVADIMVYGRASQEDIEVYEDLNARIDALGREPTAQNKRERAVLVKQRDEMVKKYNADVPDDVKVEKAIQRQQKLYDDFLNDQGAMKEVKSFMGRWAKASVKEKATIAAEIAKSLNQKEAYAKQIADRLNKLSKQSFKNGDEFKAALTSVVGGNTADQNKTMLSIMRGIGKNTESGRYADKLVANSHKHSRAVRDFLLTDKQARTGLLKSIRDAFPLRALFEGEESMALGDTIADRTILKKVFGTDNFDEIEQKLTIRDEPPPPSIVYQAKTGGSAIPIAEIVSRPDGIAYGSTWKLIMAVHDDFAKLLQQANRDILG